MLPCMNHPFYQIKWVYGMSALNEVAVCFVQCKWHQLQLPVKLLNPVKALYTLLE